MISSSIPTLAISVLKSSILAPASVKHVSIAVNNALELFVAPVTVSTAIVWFATTSSIKDSKALSPSPAVSVDSKILILSIFVSLKTTSTVMVPLFPVPVAV